LAEATDYAGHPLSPGTSLDIPIVFEVGAKAGTKYAAVHAEFAESWVSSAGALIRADVFGTWTVSADQIRFGDVRVDGNETLEHTILFQSQGSRLLHEPHADVTWLECTTRPAGTPGSVEIIARVLPARLAPGINRGRILIETSDLVIPTQEVAVYARGIDTLAAHPDHVVVPVGASASVRFYDRFGHRVTVSDASVSPGGLVTEVAGNKVVVYAASAPPEQKYRLVVHDDHGRRGQVVVSLCPSREP